MNTNLISRSGAVVSESHKARVTQALLDKIVQSNLHPCFVLAPQSCGQTELLRAAIAGSLGSVKAEILEIDEEGRWHKASGERAEQVELSLEECRLSGAPAEHNQETEHKLALFSYIPWLHDEAAERLSQAIDARIAEGWHVVVLCPVQNDRYQDLQPDRWEIRASELKEAGFLSPNTSAACLSRFTHEFVPVQIRLAAVVTAALGHCTLEELSQLGYQLSPDVPETLEKLHPLFTATDCGKGIRAEPLEVSSLEQDLSLVIAEFLEEGGLAATATVLATRIIMLSMVLLERGDLEAAHLVLEFAEAHMRSGGDTPRPLRVPAFTPCTASYELSTPAARRSKPALPGLLSAGVYGQVSQAVMQKSTPPLLSLGLFGKLEIDLGGALLMNRQLSRTKIRRLLAYLALNSHRAVSRDSLIDYLWPHLDFERAQKNLYTSWCMLARGLGSEKVRDCPYILHNGEIYQLNPELVKCDTDQFETLARLVLFEQPDAHDHSNCLAQMEALYRDTLVADIPTDGFINAKMIGYRSMMVDALLLETRQLRRTGEHEKALFYARVAYDLDETREDVYRNLMDTQLEAGQRTSAMQTYFSCKRYLADELGILPSKRTTALYQDLLLDNCQ